MVVLLNTGNNSESLLAFKILNMKRILLLITVTLLPFVGHAQYSNEFVDIRNGFYTDGFWGEWEDNYSLVPKIINSGFVLHYDLDHPSEWVVKVEFTPDTNKKRIKARYKAKEWETIPCTVTFRTQHGNLKKAMQLEELSSTGHYREIKQNGTISIAPYKIKRGMHTFNIWIGGYGLGIAFTKITIVMKKYY